MAKDNKVTADEQVIKYLEEWQRGKEYVDTFTKDFQRLDTITNALYDGPSKKNPNIGDTTTAGVAREMMRAAAKKIPHVLTSINGSQSTVEAITCRYLVQDRVLNPNTFGKGFISVLQLGGRGALSRGFTLFQISATKMYGKFGVVPKQIHYSDFAIEPGTQDGSHSPYFYIRTKMTPGKVSAIYEAELAKKKAGKATTWNLEALKAMIEVGPNSNGSADYIDYVTPVEQSKIEANTETYDVITRYSFDTSKPICTFSPGINQKLREVDNRSKFGYPRSIFLVIDPAELSPFGDSRVRLASPNQNFLMALRQNVATTWLYNSKPTLFKMGLFTGAANLKSGGVISSTDSNAKVGVISLDTTTAQQYPQISQEITKQIQNMMGMNPGQSLGAIGESKTGVGAQKQAMSVDDSIQQITNILEEFLRQYVISALDLYLAEQDGDGVIYVDDSTREDILRLNPDAFPDEKNPNALAVNWNELYDYIQEIDVSVDSTMSKQDWTNEKRADLQDMATVISQTADPSNPKSMAKKDMIEDKLIDETLPEMSTAMNTLPTPVTTQSDLTQ